jgi:hypothetical protein
MRPHVHICLWEHISDMVSDKQFLWKLISFLGEYFYCLYLVAFQLDMAVIFLSLIYDILSGFICILCWRSSSNVSFFLVLIKFTHFEAIKWKWMHWNRVVYGAVALDRLANASFCWPKAGWFLLNVWVL